MPPPEEPPEGKREPSRPARSADDDPVDVRGTVMEPVIELDGTDGPGDDAPVDQGPSADAPSTELEEVNVERDVIGTGLYRERRTVTQVVEEEVRAPKLTRAQRRQMREQRLLDKEVEAIVRRSQRTSRFSGTLAHKTFFDLVCNRLGVIIIGFGVAMTLFTMSYDMLQGREFSMGARHIVFLAISLGVFLLGVILEGLRVWSWECEGAKTVDALEGSRRPPSERAEEEGHIPMIPEDAMEGLLNGSDDPKV